nr:putative ribonuclease H-like domain-containing protein [Tanacetum cinerariifolium]
MDLFGPTSVSSISHKWYCLVVTGDFSKFTWTFFLRSKDETSDILKKFITEIENLKDYKVKIIRCDNGGEFRNKEMNDFLDVGTNSTNLLGTKDAANQEVKKDESSLRYIVLPNWAHDALLESTSSKPFEESSNQVPEGSEEGIDYDEVFAPVARIEAIRLFLAYASFIGFTVYQMYVKSAFLYGTINEEVYVMQPPGFQDPAYPAKVYKVEKAMYRLHQAPRAWYGTLSKYLLKNGFQRGTID